MPKLCVKEYPFKQIQEFLKMVVDGYDDEEIESYDFVDDLQDYAGSLIKLITKR